MCDDEENDENEALEASDISTLNENVTDDPTIIGDENEIEGIVKDDVYLKRMQGQIHSIFSVLEEQDQILDNNLSQQSIYMICILTS